jgi:hypothetical protein
MKNFLFIFFLFVAGMRYGVCAQTINAGLPACGNLGAPSISQPTVNLPSITTAEVSLRWTNVFGTQAQRTLSIGLLRSVALCLLCDLCPKDSSGV